MIDVGKLCHMEKFLHMRNVGKICHDMYNFDVAFNAVLLQNLSFMRFTLFCREIRFVAIYAHWRGEKLGQKFCLWRKKGQI